MFEKLGIVTNIWSVALQSGARFNDLMVEFGENGFRDMEVREGDYLRDSAFGTVISQLESAMPDYTDTEWKTLSVAVWNGKPHPTKHPALFEEVAAFARKAEGLTLSYAMSHPWLSDLGDADTQTIVTAKKLAYLLCPSRARLRIVDLDTEDVIDEASAVANLQRYNALLPEYPMIFAVENARQSALFTLKLAVAGGAKLTYDETNTYRADGTSLNPPEAFWHEVEMSALTSVHFKQKTEEGVLSEVGDGFVDFRAIAEHLRNREYTGDLLLENTPTSDALADALRSREYLCGLI